ncbi:hypothetical protein KOAAANKH_02223 [Brevundimonas sp. NIBR10]|uniref:hypothetical protein n=1 Tax=Brevundimonas sp. NIBR10 TaxID=3015997 RepID=UPI0022F1B988|nr:hypothetical protein [Brevundimonas sp. NIBR10]WGM47347.1 hypothetical protein KOAAANKH_02223 [Brevundimonas sp. NIBR10]
MSDTPISTLVSQGWEIVGYSTTDASGTTYQHSVLLRRQGQHKVLVLRKKILGDGVVVDSEMDV